MARATRAVVAVGLAVTTATGLIAGSAVGAAAAPLRSPGEQNAVLQLRITDNGMTVSGPTSFAAGRVKLLVEAAGKPRGAEIIQLHSGYAFSGLRDDIKAFGESFGKNGPSKSGL